MRSLMLVAALTVGLSGCMSSGPGAEKTFVEGGKVVVSRDGNMVEGRAGPVWTDQALRDNAFGAVCAGAGERIADLLISRDPSGTGTFTARCV